MVSLYSKFVRPVAYVARFGGRSNVSGSGGLYERGEFGRVIMEEHHLRSKSEFVLGIGCRTFLADCRFVPDVTWCSGFGSCNHQKDTRDVVFEWEFISNLD